MADFRFPDVGEGIQEGEVVKWLVKEGDMVKENQNIVQVETDKSVVDLPSPESGAISKIAVKEGGKIKVGGVLCTIGGSGSSSKEVSSPAKPEKAAAQAKPGEIPDSAKSKQPKKPQKSETSPQKKGLAVVGQLEEAPESEGERVEYKSQASTMRGDVQSKKTLASPAVRELAKEHNINLSKIKGSGPEGRVLKSDLSISGPISQQTIQVTSFFNPHGKIERIPLKGIRKIISDNMAISNSIPQATSMENVDITKLWAIKEKEKKKLSGVNLTLLPFIVRAAVAVLKENPYFNAYLNVESQEIFVKKYYNIGIATETPVGLMVPVVKNADKKPIEETAKEIQELAQKARDRKIAVEEMKGGSFTITNYGSIGGNYATPLINPGESAILGIGRMFEALDINNIKRKVKILPLSLTFDHRIIDGAQAARFLESLKAYLEDPNHLFVEI